MRFAEIENGIVRYVLPKELSSYYKILPPYCVAIVDDAIVKQGDCYDGKLFSSPTPEILFAREKPNFNKKRSQLFLATIWVRERHSDRLALGIDDTDNWQEWLDYWQALRDLPQQENFNPLNPVFPEQPK